jgi:hypothetical protein
MIQAIQSLAAEGVNAGISAVTLGVIVLVMLRQDRLAKGLAELENRLGQRLDAQLGDKSIFSGAPSVQSHLRGIALLLARIQRNGLDVRATVNGLDERIPQPRMTSPALGAIPLSVVKEASGADPARHSLGLGR